jgi:exosortase E/protease (VPEID-CTERM system)
MAIRYSNSEKKSVNSGILNSPLMRWGGLAVIALAELTWLSIRIEFFTLSGKVGWWTGPLSHANVFTSIGLASLASGGIIVWSCTRPRVSERVSFQETRYRRWPLILVQLVLFAAFFRLSIFVVEGEIGSSQFSGFWILVWFVTGSAAVVFWLLAALPAHVWFRLAIQGWSVLLAALLIGTATWVLGYLSGKAWKPLSGPTFLVVKWLLLAFGQEVVSQPADLLLGTEQFAVGISPACSGYAGVGLITVFVGSYWWLFRGTLRFPQAFVLLPVGILVIWLFNAVRITLLVLFGTYISPEIALGGFHSATGWIGFLAVALGMVAVSQRMPFLSQKRSMVEMVEKEAREGDPTTAYLAPLMVLLAVILVTRAFSSGSGLDWFYPVRVLGTGAAIWFLWRKRLTRLHWGSVWSGSAVGIGVAVFVVWLGLEWAMGFTGEAPAIPKALDEMPAGLATAWLIFRVLGSVVTVPMAEELAFRGYVLRRLVSPDFDKISLRFTWLSFLLSSVLFGALHGRWLAGTVAGMFYAWAMYRRSRVGDAIMAHAVTNALIVADVLILGNWNLWS